MSDRELWPRSPTMSGADQKDASPVHADDRQAQAGAPPALAPMAAHRPAARCPRLCHRPAALRERIVNAGIDVVDGALRLHTSAGDAAEIVLTGRRSVADVWADFRAALAALGVEVELWDKPRRCPTPTPFRPTRRTAASSRPRRSSPPSPLPANSIFEEFRAPFFGRSGVQFWWAASTWPCCSSTAARRGSDDRGYIMKYDLDAST